jgi:dienelactone hydrolase
MRSRFLLFFVWCMFYGTTLNARSQTLEATPREVSPREVSLPSAAPSGNAVNDQVLFRYHAVARLPGEKTPAVVLLHHSGGSGDDRRITQFAQALNRRGIAAVALTLPYHGRRRAPNQTPQRPFTANADSVQASV